MSQKVGGGRGGGDNRSCSLWFQIGQWLSNLEAQSQSGLNGRKSESVMLGLVRATKIAWWVSLLYNRLCLSRIWHGLKREAIGFVQLDTIPVVPYCLDQNAQRILNNRGTFCGLSNGTTIGSQCPVSPDGSTNTSDTQIDILAQTFLYIMLWK